MMLYRIHRITGWLLSAVVGTSLAVLVLGALSIIWRIVSVWLALGLAVLILTMLLYIATARD